MSGKRRVENAGVENAGVETSVHQVNRPKPYFDFGAFWDIYYGSFGPKIPHNTKIRTIWDLECTGWSHGAQYLTLSEPYYFYYSFWNTL